MQGDFQLFSNAFPNGLLPIVFRLMLDEWPNAPRPEGNPLENRITNRFVGHLKCVMRSYEMPRFKFSYRPKVADAHSDVESGELDILIDSFSCHPDAYLVVECKRLNIETDSGFSSAAGEYVGIGGMGCFITRQYSSGGDVGAMLGYVMTRAIDDAIKSIDNQLKAHATALCLRLPCELTVSSILPYESRVRETTHDLGDSVFKIAHLFVQF